MKATLGEIKDRILIKIASKARRSLPFEMKRGDKINQDKFIEKKGASP